MRSSSENCQAEIITNCYYLLYNLYLLLFATIRYLMRFFSLFGAIDCYLLLLASLRKSWLKTAGISRDLLLFDAICCGSLVFFPVGC